jgi:hypothetical protein
MTAAKAKGKARWLFDHKEVYEDGDIVDMKILEVPSPVKGSRHLLKYSLFYGREDVRIVCYDNERGKGDHKHIKGIEAPYTFTTIRQLIDDFRSDILKFRKNI